MGKTKDKRKQLGTRKNPPVEVAVKLYPTIFRKYFFDTETYWYYYTEVRKE